MGGDTVKCIEAVEDWTEHTTLQCPSVECESRGKSFTELSESEYVTQRVRKPHDVEKEIHSCSCSPAVCGESTML
ncbi:hypothetical protein AMECASPLE_018269 [Ameca splendens]|uniref:Uncharacterized protein n=1 Tax=Ameca splendens TaxID=208324 RepID=A0ABV1A935_9TELE